MTRPILGDVELQLVQKIETDEDAVLTQHSIPALEGDFLQQQKRRATQITLNGILTGAEAGEGLKTLRDKFRAAEPVPFVADIATAVRVNEMLIEEMGIRELAGRPERFEYAFTLREYLPQVDVSTERPSPIPAPPTDPVAEQIEADATDRQETATAQIDTRQGTLEVIVELNNAGQSDLTRLNIHVAGETEDGETLTFLMTEQENGVFRKTDMPAGEYTVSLQMKN